MSLIGIALFAFAAAGSSRPPPPVPPLVVAVPPPIAMPAGTPLHQTPGEPIRFYGPGAVSGDCIQVHDPRFDGEIAYALDAATEEARYFLKGDAKAYGLMAPYAQKSQTQAKFDEVAANVASAGPFGELTLERSVKFHVRNLKANWTSVTCGLGDDVGFLYVHANDAPLQADFQFRTRAAKGDYAVMMWLEFRDGKWSTVGIDARAMTAADLDGLAWADRARAQLAKGHAINAAALYSLAQTLLNRGGFVTTPEHAKIQAEAQKKLPKELATPITNLTLQGETFGVQLITASADKTQVQLDINQVSTWATEYAADDDNHAFIDAFIVEHPEWTDSFDNIFVRACRPDGRCFATEYARGKGYVTSASPKGVQSPSSGSR